MTEITRVPLHPIAKGSLTKLWLAIAAAVALAAALAWASMPEGVEIDTIVEGSGASPGPEDVVFVNYTGRLDDGTVFDRSQDVPLPIEGIFPEGTPLPLAQMVEGFREGAMQMQKGGTYEVTIPAELGYGEEARTDQGGNEVIPANSRLTFDVELIDFMSQDDFQARLERLQQAFQMQQNLGGGAESGVVSPPAPAQ